MTPRLIATKSSSGARKAADNPTDFRVYVEAASEALLEFARVSVRDGVKRHQDELAARMADPKQGLTRMYAHIRGESSPPTSAIQVDNRGTVSSNV